MPTLVGVVASGLFTFFNKVIVNGILGKAIFIVIFTWVISQLINGVAGVVQELLQTISPGTVFGSLGDIGAIGLWVFSFTIAPFFAVSVSGDILRFVIRRVPVIG